MALTSRRVSSDLCTFIDASPSPYHAVATIAARLDQAGFTELAETDPWQLHPGGWYMRRGGSLVAWILGSEDDPRLPYRLVGAHTDSPNLRLKPRPDTGRAGWAQLGVEVYGGALLNSWLDRDLGLSGRVTLLEANGEPAVCLIRSDEALARIPQLAIHLDREVNEKGLVLNRQQHLAPVWGLAPGPAGGFTGWLAGQLDVAPDAIAGWDLMFHDLTPARTFGIGGDLLAAPRIDNLASCHAGLTALLEHPLLAAAAAGEGPVPLLVCFDHEEVGSVSSRGADSALLPRLLERLNATRGGTVEDLAIALAGSVCLSADCAHATHPNYADRHEPGHQVTVNGGPVIKRNSNERYATDAVGEAVAIDACRRAGVPYQHFVTRSDLPCGSTIGPLTAAALGITTVDVGIPQLAMHSARETCGADDPDLFAAALAAFLT